MKLLIIFLQFQSHLRAVNKSLESVRRLRVRLHLLIFIFIICYRTLISASLSVVWSALLKAEWLKTATVCSPWLCLGCHIGPHVAFLHLSMALFLQDLSPGILFSMLVSCSFSWVVGTSFQGVAGSQEDNPPGQGPYFLSYKAGARVICPLCAERGSTWRFLVKLQGTV